MMIHQFILSPQHMIECFKDLNYQYYILKFIFLLFLKYINQILIYLKEQHLEA